ncbi:MAG TPA: TonB-dependent receptor [Vicinamibacterales bacterium]|nr:TonB-dependent receptor [Vicinamibacterales bacterium]
MTYLRLPHLAILLLLGAAATPAFAQSSTATLQGTISDAGGGVLPGVVVKLQSPDTGLEREAVTNTAGLYVFNFLPAGQYHVVAELTGFKSVRHDDVRLEIGQSLSLDMSMEVGRIEETVNVEGTAPLLDRTSPSIGTVIQSSQLKELPLAGRHWAGLMLLAPGAINTGDGTHLSTRFVGRARDDNNWTFDGIDATGVKDPRQDSSARLIISSESIAEFRVGSSLYSAESGAGAGGQVQLISKTGTNQFRGTVYDFVRNDAFDARPFGTQGELPPFRLNQFGGNLGGPLVPGRTFFFVNYEGLRQRQTQSFTRFVPSQAFRNSVTGPLAAVVAQYPAGTRATSDPNIDEWNVQQKFTADEDAPSFRLDHRFSNATSMFARYNFDNADIISPSDTGFNTAELRPANFALQFQRIFSSNVVNVTKFGYNASLRNELRTGPTDVSISVPGFVGLTGPREIIEDGRTFSILNDLGIVRGRHNVKIGGEVRRIYVDVGEGQTTSLSFSSRPNFQNNRLESFSIVDFPVVQGQRWWYFGYIQDDIKWKPNFTINAGIRYEYYSVVQEKDGRDKVWRVSCGGFCPPGTPWYNPDKNNFAPRLGFAWSPARFNDRTVIRGGFGLFFGPGQNDDVFAPIDNAGSRIALERATVPTLAYPIDPFLALAASTGNSPRAVDENRVDQYSEQYTLNIQQALPWRLVGQVGYIGNQAHHLLDRSFVNLIDPATGRRPLPQFGRVDTKSSGSSANFNGLQLSLQRPFEAGFLIGTQYMWSHALDEGSLGGGESSAPQNVACRSCEYGNTNQDIRHTLTMNWVYELPFGANRRYLQNGGVMQQIFGGWNFSGLLQARTGRPLTISVNRSAADLPDGNNSGQRPDLVAGVSPYPSERTPERWLNIEAFAVPARGTWGNAPRNFLRGPGLFQVDLAVQKRFVLAGTRNIEFRWEAFNAFNRQNLANPNTNLSSGPASFGRITGPLNLGYGTGTARQMQFMLRMNF